MKFLKYFENIEDVKKMYWKVRTDEPYFTIILDKIGMDKKNQKSLKNDDMINICKHVFIGVEIRNNIYKWTFVFETYNHYFKNSDYEFMGKPNVEDYELNAYKYNL